MVCALLNLQPVKKRNKSIKILYPFFGQGIISQESLFKVVLDLPVNGLLPQLAW